MNPYDEQPSDPGTPLHPDDRPGLIGVPYHRAVLGPDGMYWWAQCPRCGEVVLNQDGHGPGRHWEAQHEPLPESRRPGECDHPRAEVCEAAGQHVWGLAYDHLKETP